MTANQSADPWIRIETIPEHIHRQQSGCWNIIETNIKFELNLSSSLMRFYSWIHIALILVTKRLNLSPKTQNCRLHILSPTSITDTILTQMKELLIWTV